MNRMLATMAVAALAAVSTTAVAQQPLQPMNLPATTAAATVPEKQIVSAPVKGVSEASFANQARLSVAGGAPSGPLKPISLDSSKNSAALAEAASVTATLPAGQHLSEALEGYVRNHGWTLRWNIENDYILDAPLPIPSPDVIEAVTWVVNTYQSQGGLLGVMPRFARSNRVVVIEMMNVRDN